MPKRRFSSAITLVNPRIPNFDVVYAAVSDVPVTESIEPMFTIDPPPIERMIGSTVRTPMNGPMQFTRSTRSNASTVVMSMVARCKHGRVVDEYVDAALALADLVDDGLPLVLARDVQVPVARPVAQLLRRGLATIVEHVDEGRRARPRRRTAARSPRPCRVRRR